MALARAAWRAVARGVCAAHPGHAACRLRLAAAQTVAAQLRLPGSHRPLTRGRASSTAADTAAGTTARSTASAPATSRSPAYPLRPYQEACVEASLRALAVDGVRRQAVSLPVGSGKTVIFSSLIGRVPLPEGHPSATKTLVLAHRGELLEQAWKRISDLNPDLEVALEKGPLMASPTADVVVASVPTLGRAHSTRLAAHDPARFKCIVIDEAHHATASTYRRVLDHFGVFAPDSHILLWGCSATLRRHDAVSLGDVFERIVYQHGILDMWGQGWLCRPRVVTVKTHVDLSGVRASKGDFVLGVLSQASNTPLRNRIIYTAWREHAEAQARRSTLIFAVDIKHIRALVALFMENGVEARSVDGSTSAEARAVNVEDFRRGAFPVLVNCGVFTEGTDIPCIDCVIMGRPTRSSVLFQQMMGRGLRLFDGKQDCLFVDIVDSFRRNDVITTPSLLGLLPSYQANGEDIIDAHDAIVTMGKTHAPAMLATSLTEAETMSRIAATQTQLDDIEDQEQREAGRRLAQLVDLKVSTVSKKVNENPQEPHWKVLTDLNFILVGGDFFLDVKDLGLIRLTRADDVDGEERYVAEVCEETPMGFLATPIPLEADSLGFAFSAVKSYLQQYHPEHFKTMLREKFAYDETSPSTPKQNQLLRRLYGRGYHRLGKKLTKAQAARAIDQVLTRRKANALAKKIRQINERHTMHKQSIVEKADSL